MTPCGRRVSTQFLVFPISNSVDITVHQHGKCFIFCNIAQKSLAADWREIIRVNIELYQHGF